MRIIKILIVGISIFIFCTNILAGKIGIIVNKDLYSKIETAVEVYIADLQSIEGKGAWLQATYFDDQTSPQDLRDSLKKHYDNDDLEGAVLIGDLPLVHQKDDGKWGLTDFWYMDLDSEWEEDPSKPPFYFDGDVSGDHSLEIWTSRIIAGVLEETIGLSEEQIVNNYLERVHKRMIGDFQADMSMAILGNSNEWSGIERENKNPFEGYYDPIDCYRYGQDTKTNWINELESGNEFQVIYEHSSYSSHSTYNGSTKLSDIANADKNVRFVNSYACSNGRYTVPNMGSTYALDDNGLWSISCLRTGSMHPSTFSEFNEPLVEGKSVGEAFIEHQVYCCDRLNFSTNLDWNYGLYIGGCGNLKIAPYPVVSLDDIIQKPLKSLEIQVFNNRLFYQVPEMPKSKEVWVKIDLYTMNGAAVKTLIDKERAPGKHSINLEKGINKLARGVYICKVEINGINKNVRIVHR